MCRPLSVSACCDVRLLIMIKSNKIWLTYYVIYITLTLLEYGYSYPYEGEYLLTRGMDLVCFLILVTAMYGYIFNRIMLTSLSWKILKYLYLFLLVVGISSYGAITQEKAIIILLTIILLAPGIVALFKYTSIMENHKRNNKSIKANAI